MKPARYTPKPAQAHCHLCERLFAYFQTSKRRMYCNACVEIERRAAQVFSNDRQRRDRLEARENARLIHAESEIAA
jgi:hypothetical protein